MHYRIAELNFGQISPDSPYSFNFKGNSFEVQRYGAQYSAEIMIGLIEHYRSQVDALAISSLPTAMKVGCRTFLHKEVLEVMSTPVSIPLCDGGRVREVSIIKGLIKAIETGRLQPQEGIFLPSGLLHLEASQFLLKKHPDKVAFGDLCVMLGLPKKVEGEKAFNRLAKGFLYFSTQRDLKKQGTLRVNQWKKKGLAQMVQLVAPYRYIYGGAEFLATFEESLNFIKGKSIILPYSPTRFSEKFKGDFGASEIIDLFPPSLKLDPNLSFSVLDATLRLSGKKTAPLTLEEWENLLNLETEISFEARPYIAGGRPSPQVQVVRSLHSIKRKLLKKNQPDFAFIVHALSIDDLFRIPGLSWGKSIPVHWKRSIEIIGSKLPGVVYGELNHVVSRSNGRAISGLIYGVPSTPKMLKEEDIEATYRKIKRLCEDADSRGAKIMGLGAYTKIVGDAGETINRMSPIPVTTGNSLSASTLLWALREALLKMGLLPIHPFSQIFQGTAMIVGATGSIGSVCAQLLSLVFEKIILVAPRLDKLEQLKQEIHALSPQCQVLVTAKSEQYASCADAVVTATSTFDEKILDVELLKPGCVICDCSRPLNFTLEDVLKRPDILIVESGEVILPGRPQLTCDIGLPRGIVYGCLGETVVLALEGRFESFTIGRDISWEKVREIYKLSRKHGVELAAIRGHMGIISNKEIQLIRELALKYRSETGRVNTCVSKEHGDFF